MTVNRGLYLHIPFCARKCAYCDFYSVALDTDLADLYSKEVCRELSLVLERYPGTLIDTVYIGGGTPGILPPSFLERIVAHIYKSACVDIKEFSIEVNPCSSSHFSFYKSLGINRVSIGVQSLDDVVLKTAGRLHDRAQALDALERAANLFSNVSADVMLGLPGQDIMSIEKTLTGVMPHVKHISIYLLKLSEGVPMAKSAAKGELTLPDDDVTADMYDAGYSLMQNNGFGRYEISNFAHVGYSCMHNQKYWNRQDYIGIGPAAHSFLDGVRYDNPADIKAYLDGAHLGNGRANAAILTPEDALFEYIMLKLRQEEGFCAEEISRLFHIDFYKEYQKELHSLRDILDVSGGRICMKQDKMLLESLAARAFLR